MFNSFKKIIKGLCVLSVLSLTTTANVQAQLGEVGEILRAGAGDANTLLEKFLNPYINGFGADLNTGWFSTAKSHQKLGFDISINVAAAVVPTTDQIFNVNDLNLTELVLISGNPETPTIAGANSTDTRLGVLWDDPRTPQDDDVLFDFEIPSGTDFPYAPAPMIQASVGLIKDTDISLRYIPQTDFNVDPINSSLGLFGFGVKHGINQWLPGEKLIPVDLSVQFGYTAFNASAGFDVLPQDESSDVFNPYNDSNWDGQGIDLETKASTFNAIVGKTLPIISVYAGLGIESSKTTITTPGAYPLTSPATPDDQSQYPNEIYHPQDNPDGATQIIREIDSPIDLEIKGSNSMRAFVGTRIRLTVLQISASYTLANYSTFNVGFGISLR